MEDRKYAVGLDIGTTKIVAMIGAYNEYNKLEILGVGKTKSQGVKRGVVNNISQTINSIEIAVKEAETHSGLKVEEVTVGIAGKHIRSLQHQDYILRDNPEEVIDQKDIEQLCDKVQSIVLMPGEAIIHVLPQTYKVDGQDDITEPVGMYGGRVDARFIVIVGQLVQIKNIYRCVEAAGLKVRDITLEPIASSEAVLQDEETEAGVALIDIGGGTTDIAIFKDNMIQHSAVLPFGGKIITEDIKEGCSIIEKMAEQLKVKFGSAHPENNSENVVVAIQGMHGRPAKEISTLNLAQIINARMEEILALAYREIDLYLEADQRRKLVSGVVITGGGALLKHLVQVVEYRMRMDTRIGLPNEHLQGDMHEELASPIYSTSVGLVMRALKNQADDEERAREEALISEPIAPTPDPAVISDSLETEPEQPEEPFIPQPTKSKRGIMKYFDQFKRMLDDAE